MPRVVSEAPVIEKQVVCRAGCGRTIAYVPNDVQRRDGRDYTGGPDGEEYVLCPGAGCGKKIVLRAW